MTISSGICWTIWALPKTTRSTCPMSRPLGGCTSADWVVTEHSGNVGCWCSLRSAVATPTDTSVFSDRGTALKEFHMSISREVKQQLIAEYATHEGDTGSPEVQVAVLSRRIANLTA